jgi:hypothetical protein
MSVNMNINLFRARTAQVKKVILPKLNNITPLNNTIYFRVIPYNILYTAVLPTGLYSPLTLCNEMAVLMQDAYTGGLFNLPDTFSCTFDDIHKTFQLTGPADFYIISSSNFIIRGRSVALFPSFNDLGSGNPPPASFVSFTYSSGRAGMAYTKFVTIHSQALNQYSYGDSKTSDAVHGANMIAVVDSIHSYNPKDYELGTPFTGSYESFTLNSPILSVLNPQTQLIKFLDFNLRDEYGFGLALSVSRQEGGASDDIGYSTITIPVEQEDQQFSLWLNVTF